LEEPRARFYAAEISLALMHLHDMGLMYRQVGSTPVCCSKFFRGGDWIIFVVYLLGRNDVAGVLEKRC